MSQGFDGSQETTLADLIERATDSIQRGEDVDVEELAQCNPRFAAQIRELLPAIKIIEGIGHGAHEPRKRSQEGTFLGAGNAVPDDGTLGDFRLQKEIGRGGMGVVYEAHQISLNRIVALKVLPFASVLDTRRLQRFTREAQAAASLKHPNIVSVHSVGCERGVHYYAMEYVDGQSLAQVIEGLAKNESRTKATSSTAIGALSTQRLTNPLAYYRSVAELGIDASLALEHAHREGVVHRDIKPSNLLLDGDGKVWITDFGLAYTQTESQLTITGDMVGTMRYMSSEQAAGDRNILDQRTDIYSLGATLYELLTLRPAMDAENRQQLLHQVLNTDPVLPRKIQKEVPADLETIVLKMLQKSADARYASARQVADDLQRWLDNRPIRARRSGKVDDLRRWIMSNRVTTALLATAGVLLIALAVGGWSVGIREAQTSRRQNQLLYDADMRIAQHAFGQGDFKAVDKLLRKHAATRDAEDQRGFEWFYLWEACRRWRQSGIWRYWTNVTKAAYAPDGSTYVVGTWDGRLFICDGVSLEPIRMVDDESGDYTRGLAYAPNDSNLFASLSQDKRLNLWEVSSGARLQITEDIPKSVNSFALSPDGRLLATGHNAEIQIWGITKDWAEGQRTGTNGGTLALQRLDKITDESLRGSITSLSFSRDSDLLAGAGDGPAVLVWDVADTSQSAVILTGHDEKTFRVLFSPISNTILASASGVFDRDDVGGEVCLWDVESRTRLQTLKGHQSAVVSLAFSPQGDVLASGSVDRTIRLSSTRSGELIDVLRGHGRTVTGLAFDPTKPRTLVSTSDDHSVHVWDLGRTRPPSQMVGHQSWMWGLAWLDDDCLLSGATDATVRFWHSRSGAETGHLRFRGPGANLAVAEDRKLLAIYGGNWPTGKGDGAELTIWELPSKAQKHRLVDGPGFISAACFLPDSSILATATMRDDKVRIWNAETGEEKDSITIGSFDPNVWELVGLDFETLIAPIEKGFVVHNITTNRRRVILLDEGTPHAMALSRDKRLLATGGWSGIISVFDTRSWERLVTCSGHRDTVQDLDFHPEGKRLVSASADGTVRIWNAVTGSQLLTMHHSYSWVLSAAFSPDGQTLAAGDGVRDPRKRILLWRATDHRSAEAELKKKPRFRFSFPGDFNGDTSIVR